ncbi:uncharacterized protein BCR38DRAFT_159703 [Pseudomassariella vexata]|uniref:PH domain-containing protein n=1 Tax=Pseudomassariella vexata TaxID=1141098 RepID=A0A1Y2E7I3_9PEZI|nr:uncharacterized protein BCR38DRAFT_159703 [Pseudomassariella vexata]ORY67533.1 hypothetical protein BCR38DRAFT_159703 [Pseudomassariella vexata]
MATLRAPDDFSSPVSMEGNDPFIVSHPDSTRHRFSNFDAHVFALGPNASPAQAKRALEAHLAETTRRMAEAGKLGQALVAQEEELRQRLEEVEQMEQEGELSQDLRQKLAAVEKDYNDVARESAKAFLPKPRIPSNEAAAGSPFVPEGRGNRRSISPSKFEAQATGSPLKSSLPNRKLRNQPASRVHDIEFAAEISTQLIAQVRQLQSVLAEKEEELKDIKVEKSKLEYEAEGFQQRLKSLDESEGRYKDENWSLETQVHDLTAAQRESADREKKLQQMVNVLQAEKNSAQRELDEVKLGHARLTDEYATAVKQHDTELGAAKRNIAIAEAERQLMHRKLDDLASQNQELAQAISSQRGRMSDRQEAQRLSDEDFATANDDITPEHSPPPSPIKGTPRHSFLESETLKTSLGHAQRTIQSLRTNFHREKTEKLELRRMLQDVRDELEKARQEPPPPSRRARKAESRDLKKPPRLLGSHRSSRSEIIIDDPNWEDQPDGSPNQSALHQRGSVSTFEPVMESIESENFEMANETSDQAFETANERETETEDFQTAADDTDDFQTGAEDFSSEGAETETDSPSKRHTLRGRPPSFSTRLQRSGSLHSTASTEDEYEFDDMKTPSSQFTNVQHKFPLRVGRGAMRRSRQASEDAAFQSSPASFVLSRDGTPQVPVQSLAAELGEFDNSDNDSTLSATPSKRSIRWSRPGSRRETTASPPPAVPRLPRRVMVDTGTMTEPLPELRPSSPMSVVTAERPMSMGTVVSQSGMSEYSEGHDFEENLAKFPSPPTSPPRTNFALSSMHAHEVEAIEELDTRTPELEALKEEHAKQIEQLHAENAAARDAALEALESSHTQHLNRSIEDVQAAHAQELEALTSGHTDHLSRSIAEVKTAHTQELEELKCSHVEHLTRSINEVKSAHARELETLKSGHNDETLRLAADAKAAHAQELEALQATHAAKIAQMESDSQAAHASEIAALKTRHEEQLAASKKESDEMHAAELAALVAAHAAQIEDAKRKLTESHDNDLESLKTSHMEQIEHVKQDSDAAHADELEAMKATHLAQIDAVKESLAGTHEQELEALKAAHALQVEHFKQASEAAHAAELAALVALHEKQLESSKAEGDATLTRELEALKDSHAKQLESSNAEAAATLEREIQALQISHAQQMDSTRAEGDAKLAKELNALEATHLEQLASSKAEAEATLSKEIEALKSAHAQQLASTKAEGEATLENELQSLKAIHAKQLEDSKQESDAAHAAEIAALVALHEKQLASAHSDSEATLSKELAALKDAHAKELQALRSEHDTAHAQELETFKAAVDKQIESSKTEGNAAHTQQIEAINSAHAEIVEVHKRDSEKLQSQLEALSLSHEKQIEALKTEHSSLKTKEINVLIAQHDDRLKALVDETTAAKSKALDELASKQVSELDAIRSEHATLRSKELAELAASHEQHIEMLTEEHAISRSREIDDLIAKHESQLGALRAENAAIKSRDLQELTSSHEKQIENLKTEATAAKTKEIDELVASHQSQIEALKADAATSKARELGEMAAQHSQHIASLKSDHESAIVELLEELAASHALKLEALRTESESSKAAELETLHANHATSLQSLRDEHEASRTKDLEGLKSTHDLMLDSLRTEHRTVLDDTIQNLNAGHAKDIDSLRDAHTRRQEEALDILKSSHAEQLDALRAENEAALARAVGSAKAEHEQALEAHRAESLAEKEKLLASHALELEALKEKLLAGHAAELEALRASLTVQPPSLGYSSVNAVETQPVEDSESLRSPKREAFMIPRDSVPKQPQTPNGSAIAVVGRKGKGVATPVIAEDETRQSPSSAAGPETPESQRPFKEISINTDVRQRKQPMPTADQGAQTALTSDGLDRLLSKNQRRNSQESFILTTPRGAVIPTPFDDANTPTTIRHKQSNESMGGVGRARTRVSDSSAVSAPEPVPARRPGSSSSARGSVPALPPLPVNHREAIEAARTGSSSGKSAMGPPLLPASAYKNSAARPRTPGSHSQLSPTGRGTPTPRAMRTNSSHGYGEVHSPSKMTARSRQSSVSSFASEIDTRFNTRTDMYGEAAGLTSPGTDPRMIQAITQTMIGEYLWKYTRKAGRGEMSENRHRRYFWVHPYTRTLYWSDRDPSNAGRTELKAKSVPIEAVRVVTDDNIMPPGLHRKSLVIISPGRTIKFTCTTGQRHETWFNALSYLLLRTGHEGHTDAEEIAGNITQEDVEEFNPSYGPRSAHSNTPRGPPSLSSYNSRTTRNESPTVDLNIPTLTPTHERTSARPHTLSRLSGSFFGRTSTTGSGIFNSLRARSQTGHGDNTIYEASEVHDSAEDVRQIIEQQDREADRLENVRACCDGKHDVGTLAHSGKKGRPGYAHSHTHPGRSTTPTPMATTRSRPA